MATLKGTYSNFDPPPYWVFGSFGHLFSASWDDVAPFGGGTLGSKKGGREASWAYSEPQKVGTWV